jgi:hypothetical protein
MIWATVLERKEGVLCAQERGNYAFLQIPTIGDHVQLWNPIRQHFDFMEVLSIEHIPMPDPEQSASDWEGLKKAAVLIICKLIGELGSAVAD